MYLRAMRTTPTGLSRQCGVDQSTIQRFLSGRTKTLTPQVQAILTHAGIGVDLCIESTVHPVDHPRIREALEKAWDGRDETAELLAGLIEAVAPALRRSHTSSQT